MPVSAVSTVINEQTTAIGSDITGLLSSGGKKQQTSAYAEECVAIKAGQRSRGVQVFALILHKELQLNVF